MSIEDKNEVPPEVDAPDLVISDEQVRFKVSMVDGIDDVTLHTLTVNNISYELVATEDNHKYVYSSSKLFRNGFRVSDSAERLVMVGKQLMITNEDDSLDELVDLTDANTKIVSIEHKVYLSDRGIPLVYMGSKADKPVITIENTGKWYKLFVVNPDGEVNDLDVVVANDTGYGVLPGFDDWIDHCPKPDDLVVYAEKNDFYVDEQSLEMMIGRIVIEKDYILDNSFEHTNIISNN